MGAISPRVLRAALQVSADRSVGVDRSLSRGGRNGPRGFLEKENKSLSRGKHISNMLLLKGFGLLFLRVCDLVAFDRLRIADQCIACSAPLIGDEQRVC